MFSQSTRPARPMQEYVARLILHHSNSTIKSLLGQEKKSARKNTLRSEVYRINEKSSCPFCSV